MQRLRTAEKINRSVAARLDIKIPAEPALVSQGQMLVLSAIVETLMRSMLNSGHDLASCPLHRSAACQ